MNQPIPNIVARRIQDRQALLWICQRHDIQAGDEPHDYGVPPEEAALRYRSTPTETDELLGNLYWEAVWLEGARSPVMTAMRTADSDPTNTNKRPLVALASEADTNAQVSSKVFLP